MGPRYVGLSFLYEKMCCVRACARVLLDVCAFVGRCVFCPSAELFAFLQVGELFSMNVVEQVAVSPDGR